VKKPSSPEEQADFLAQNILPMWVNDLTTVIEARCPEHGKPGHSANFTATLMCLIACESLADLLAPSTISNAYQCRRWFWTELSGRTGDSRYAILGEPMFVWFRHGIGHRFLPKSSDGMAGGAMYRIDAEERSACALKLFENEHQKELMNMRAEWHLRKMKGALVVLPQVLVVDVVRCINDFSSKLQSRDRATLGALPQGFDRWFADVVTVRNRSSLTDAEWDVIENRTPAPSLRVGEYEPVMSSTGLVPFWLEGTQDAYVLHEDSVLPVSFPDRASADDRYASRARALSRPPGAE
jgi:hypothetical protein